MSQDHNGELPRELESVAAMLRNGRPELSALELDELQQQVRTRARRGSHATRSRRTTFMKSRMAIAATLVLGMMFSTTGAGLAVSGLVDSRSAQEVQYPEEKAQSDVLGEVGEVEETAPQEAQQAAPQQEAVAAPRQTAATDGDSLPFTGFSAVPVLLLGIGLLGLGLVLRRRSDDIGQRS